MTNTSNFINFESQRALLMELYRELVEFIPSAGGPNSALWVIALILVGWLLFFWTILITYQVHPLSKRQPSRAVFFAAFQEKIRRNFRCQQEEALDTLMVGVNRVLGVTPEEPTVFLFLAPHGTMSTTRKLVTLLVHCILIAYNYPSDERNITQLLTDGSHYTSYNDEWPFYHHMRKQLRFYGVSAIFAFEQLHPQVIRALSLLVPMIFSPYPESVIILVIDLRNRFTDYQRENLTANQLGRIFLQEHLSPYFERSLVYEMINQLGSRCIVVNTERSVSQHSLSV